MAAMRRTAGIALISLGAIGLMVCGIVLLRLPLPIPGVLLGHLGIFGFHIDPVEAPVSSLAFLTIGIFLLWRSKGERSK